MRKLRWRDFSHFFHNLRPIFFFFSFSFSISLPFAGCFCCALCRYNAMTRAMLLMIEIFSFHLNFTGNTVKRSVSLPFNFSVWFVVGACCDTTSHNSNLLCITMTFCVKVFVCIPFFFSLLRCWKDEDDGDGVAVKASSHCKIYS